MSQQVILQLSQRWDQSRPGLAWRSAPANRLPHGSAPSDDIEDVTNWALSQPSQFAAVITSAQRSFLVTDLPRSIPLLYAKIDGKWVVSDDINLLLDAMPSAAFDPEAVEQFRHMGIVLGSRTLVSGVCQVPACTIVVLDHEAQEEPRSLLYRRFRYDRQLADDNETFETAVLSTLRQRVQDVVDLAGDRLVALPLSGGIDSRLLAVLVAEAQPRNVMAFTYGMMNSREAKISKKVADDLGIPWIFVESSPEEVKKAWKAHGERFLRQCWAGASLPHYQDWYALHVLTSSGQLPPGSIILPGHTIVGNLHDEDLARDPQPMSRGAFSRLLLQHHGILQGDPQALATLDSVHEAMIEFFAEVDYDGCVEERQSLIEWFNIRERQAKYINNSMRPYEAFGLDWALPMLDTAMINTWQHGSREATDESRKWYGDLTSRLYTEVTGVDEGYFASGVASLPPKWKQLGINFAERSGLATLLRRSLSARVQLHHPMAFQALLGDRSTLTLIPRMMRGSSIHGYFAEAFLEGTWIDGVDVLSAPID